MLPAHFLSTEWRSSALKVGMIIVILAPFIGFLLVYPPGLTEQENERFSKDWFKILAMMVLSAVLPLMAYSYYFFRRERRSIEVDRIMLKLKLQDNKYVEMFRHLHSGPYFLIAVALAWVVSLGGLTILFFGERVWADGDNALEFPKKGSWLVFGMAFLGAYIWGLQYIFRRYVLNDLIPGAFFRLTIRMLMASTVALIVYNAYQAFAGDETEKMTGGAWPALAFLLGAFPQRGLNWLVSKIPILSDQSEQAGRSLPLEIIEGLDAYDKMRLEEIGIDDCYDLANYDFVPMILKTSYDARTIADWILQAKLCVLCGDAVVTLRHQGIRGIRDLAELDEGEIVELANTTTATLLSLKRARTIAMNNPDIKRLQEVAGRLTKYTELDVPEAPER